MAVELSDSELLALVTLARYVMRADGRVTEEEIRTMMAMAREVGLRAFSDALERTDDAPRVGRDELMQLAGLVKGEEKRAYMFELLKGVAAADQVDEAEQDLLDALAVTWGL